MVYEMLVGLHEREGSRLGPGIPQVRDVAPDFKLLNASREIWHLEERVAQQPTILILYRGHW